MDTVLLFLWVAAFIFIYVPDKIRERRMAKIVRMTLEPGAGISISRNAELLREIRKLNASTRGKRFGG